MSNGRLCSRVFCGVYAYAVPKVFVLLPPVVGGIVCLYFSDIWGVGSRKWAILKMFGPCRLYPLTLERRNEATETPIIEAMIPNIPRNHQAVDACVDFRKASLHLLQYECVAYTVPVLFRRRVLLPILHFCCHRRLQNEYDIYPVMLLDMNAGRDAQSNEAPRR